MSLINVQFVAFRSITVLHIFYDHEHQSEPRFVSLLMSFSLPFYKFMEVVKIIIANLIGSCVFFESFDERFEVFIGYLLNY